MPKITNEFLKEVAQMVQGIVDSQIPAKDTQSNKLYSRFLNDKKMAGEATLGQYLAYYSLMRQNAFYNQYTDEKGHFQAIVSNDDADLVNKMERLIETKFHLTNFPFLKVASSLGLATNNNFTKDPTLEEEIDLADYSAYDMKEKKGRLDKTDLSNLTPNLTEDIVKGVYRDAPKSPEYKAKEAEIQDETKWGLADLGKMLDTYAFIQNTYDKMNYEKAADKRPPVDLLAATRGENKTVDGSHSVNAEEIYVGKLYAQVNQNIKNRTFWQIVSHPIDSIREVLLANKLESRIQNRFGLKGEEFKTFVKNSYDMCKQEKQGELEKLLPKTDAPAQEPVKDEKAEILETWEVVENLETELNQEKNLEEVNAKEETIVQTPEVEMQAEK